MPLTAEQAELSVQNFIRKQRTQRRLPELPPSMKKFAEDTQVHVYNVGPWDHWVPLGSWGMFYIPKCEIGEQFAAMKPIPGVFTEPIIRDEHNFELAQIEGRYVAEQVVGIGKGLAWDESRQRLGVFIGAAVGPKAEPTREEVAEARGLLHQTYNELFEEAEAAYASPIERINVIGSNHRIAAKALNRTYVKWMQDTSRPQMKNCPNCGTASEGSVVSCPQCTYVFDPEAFREMQSRLAANIRIRKE
jgi:hypothetical protein